MGIRRLLFLQCFTLVTGCTDGPPEPTVQPDVCDGSEGTRLLYADWFAGTADVSVDLVMFAEGVRFLKVDGTCHYYVFNGEDANLRWWSPVKEGDLTADALEELLTRLQVARWSEIGPDDTSYVYNPYHGEWTRFEVGDDAYECAGSCALGSFLLDVMREGNLAVDELSAVSEPVEPSRLEVLVVESRVPNTPYAIEWDAPIPMADLQQDTSVAYLSGDPDDIGILVEGDDVAWFADKVDTYLGGVMAGAPSGIGILDESGETSHTLMVRTIVP